MCIFEINDEGTTVGVRASFFNAHPFDCASERVRANGADPLSHKRAHGLKGPSKNRFRRWWWLPFVNQAASS